MLVGVVSRVTQSSTSLSEAVATSDSGTPSSEDSLKADDTDVDGEASSSGS